MPLRQCRTKNQYQYFFITGGPFNKSLDFDALRTSIRDVILSHMGSNRVLNLQIALEVSEDNYHHFHVALHTPEARWVSLNNKLLKLIRSWPVDPLETRKPNTGFFYVPQGVTDPWELMTKYLGNPTKVKDTDSNILEFSVSDKWWLDASGQPKPDTPAQPYNTAAYFYYNFALMRGDEPPPFDPKKHLTKSQRESIRWTHLSDADRQKELATANEKSRALFLDCLKANRGTSSHA